MGMQVVNDGKLAGHNIDIQNFKSQGGLAADGKTVVPLFPEGALAQGKSSMHPGILEAGAFMSLAQEVHRYAMVPHGQAMEFYRSENAASKWNPVCSNVNADVTKACDLSEGGTEVACREAYEKCLDIVEEPYGDHADKLLEELFPDIGTFHNEANIDMENRPERIWTTERYNKLMEIKHEVDPDGFFFVRGGVASEEWSEDGNCRLH